MRIAYFDCFSGAAGDMIVGSLLDCGLDFALFSKSIAQLNVGGYEISARKIKKQGLAATQFLVNLFDAPQPHRHLRHIVEIINSAQIPAKTRDQAIKIFTRLAEAEAKVHGTTVEKVHFHEVGAVDAIVDVVGACVALEMLGVERVICSAIPVGSGSIRCEHGVMPVPAPATAELLKGVPIAASDEVGELTTPTGAAILTTLASEFSPLRGMAVSALGYGAGTRDGKTRPNVLRALVGEAVEAETAAMEAVLLLETNLDDCSPQIAAYSLERALAAGALDAWAQPIQMKKQRTGILLSILCRPDQTAAMERILFAETPTLGIRRRLVERKALARRIEVVTTKFGDIRVKVAEFQGTPSAMPEFEDCKEAAVKHGAALRDVQAAAIAEWRLRQNS